MLGRRELMLSAGAAMAAGPALGSTPPSYSGGDVALLRRAFGTLHPGLLRYSTQTEMDQRFDSLEHAFNRASNLAGRYLAISTFLASVKCGHTYANFYNQRPSVRSELFDSKTRLPFRFLWLADRMIVTAGPAGTALKPGIEVISINGRPCGEIIRGLMTVARADGSNDAKRRRLMSVTGADGYQSFDIFYPLMFGFTEHYVLGVRDLEGRETAVTAEAIDLTARRAQSKLSEAPAAALWSFQMRGRSAVLTMPTWAMYDSEWDWRLWLDARFEEMAIRRATGLIVDLRDNEGGDDCGDSIIARLIAAPLALENALRLVRYRKTPDALKPYLDTWDSSFMDWGSAATPYNDRYFRLLENNSATSVGKIRPKGPHFDGKLAILIGPQNSSATFHFAEHVRKAKLGVLVGEATGGNRRGINGGAFFFLRLPESGLEVDLPLIGQYPVSDMPDAGLTPDVAVPMTAIDIETGKDPAMEAALGLVA